MSLSVPTSTQTLHKKVDISLTKASLLYVVHFTSSLLGAVMQHHDQLNVYAESLLSVSLSCDLSYMTSSL